MMQETEQPLGPAIKRTESKPVTECPIATFESPIATFESGNHGANCGTLNLSMITRLALSILEKNMTPPIESFTSVQVYRAPDHLITGLPFKPVTVEPRPADGWVAWEGGECPVDGDAIVMVKQRGGSGNLIGVYTAANIHPSYWENDNYIFDIVAYRVVG